MPSHGIFSACDSTIGLHTTLLRDGRVMVEIQSSFGTFKGFSVFATQSSSITSQKVGSWEVPTGLPDPALNARLQPSCAAISHSNRSAKTAMKAFWKPDAYTASTVNFHVQPLVIEYNAYCALGPETMSLVQQSPSGLPTTTGSTSPSAMLSPTALASSSLSVP